MDAKESFQLENISKTDFFDFVSAPDMNVNISELDLCNDGNGNVAKDIQPLQGFDQFWGPDKDGHRLETSLLDDTNKFYWTSESDALQAATSSTNDILMDSNNDSTANNPDNQVYTITVLNSSLNDQWMRKDISSVIEQTEGIDIDTILASCPLIKTEYLTYDSNEAQEIKHVIKPEPQQTEFIPNHEFLRTVTKTNLDELPKDFNDLTYNNNDWKIVDQYIKQESSESLLRSALQGKGYIKSSLPLTNDLQLPLQNSQIKSNSQKISFSSNQDAVLFADSPYTTNTIISELSMSSTNPMSNNEFGDDMFSTLDSSFTEDIEKIKTIASEVQQFCIASPLDNTQNIPNIVINNNVTDIIQKQTNAANANTKIISDSITDRNLKITHNKPRWGGSKETKKYKKIYSNGNLNDDNNNTSDKIDDIKSDSNNNKIEKVDVEVSSNQIKMSPNKIKKSVSLICTSGSDTNNSTGPRKERSLHYCSICSKGFKDKYSVNVHIRTHTGEKPFKCSLCGKSFRQKAHLAKHYQTHISQKNGSNGSNKASKATTSIQSPPSISLSNQNNQPHFSA